MTTATATAARCGRCGARLVWDRTEDGPERICLLCGRVPPAVPGYVRAELRQRAAGQRVVRERLPKLRTRGGHGGAA